MALHAEVDYRRVFKKLKCCHFVGKESLFAHSNFQSAKVTEAEQETCRLVDSMRIYSHLFPFAVSSVPADLNPTPTALCPEL